MTHIIRTALVALFVTSLALCQNATVSVLHGIPGLPQPVEVFANGTQLFTFDFGDLQGPLSVPAGVTLLEVRLNGATVLQASPDLQDGVNYTVVAHLQQGGGTALTAFVNDLSRVQGIGEYFATVAFRHVADAPLVDVYADRYGREVFVYGNVANGEEGLMPDQAPAYMLSGPYDLRLTAAGSTQTAFGPTSIGFVGTGNFYSVFAIGDLAQGSFRYVVQEIITPVALPTLQIATRGTSCGGSISFSTNNIQFDQPFDIILTGGTPNSTAFLISGFDTSSFFGIPLPLDLTSLGAPGCFLYQDIAGVLDLDTDANGEARLSMTIPAPIANIVRTYSIHFQYAFLSPGANMANLLLTESISIEAL